MVIVITLDGGGGGGSYDTSLIKHTAPPVMMNDSGDHREELG